MEYNRTTFVLGAGVNKEINSEFYLGNDLLVETRNRVTDISSKSDKYFSKLLQYEVVKIENHVRDNFVKDLDEYISENKNGSIDAFINEIASKKPEFKKEYIKIAKISTLFHILGCERGRSIDGKQDKTIINIEEDIRQRLTCFAKLAEYLENNNFNKGINIITFNYDRILEEYLFQYFEHSPQITDFVNTNIQHVYGRIGYYNGLSKTSYDEQGIAFALLNNNIDQIVASIDNVKLIYEERDVNFNIKEVIKNSNQILILGYAFDNTNNKRIGLDKIDKNKAIIRAAVYKREDIELVSSKLGEFTNDFEIENRSCSEFLAKYLS